MTAEDEKLCNLDTVVWAANHGMFGVKELVGRIRTLSADNARLTAELAYMLSELDEASPLTECARCRQWFRLHNMTPEEGDEWECRACWERCNALEDAQRKALAGDAGEGG